MKPAPLPLEIDQTQLRILLGYGWKPYGAEGWMPASWADVVLNEWEGFDPPLPTIRHNRVQLRAYCRDPTTPPMHAFIAVMAWGGQVPRSGKYREEIRARQEMIEDLIQQVRAGMPRDKAYDLWRNKVWGLGPSFFTKLLCFLCPNGDMAIMDQWAVKAVNVLYSREVIRLAPCNPKTLETSPCKSNTGQDYERYCRHLEDLKTHLGEQTLSATEERVFSRWSAGRATWRSHVKNTWRPATGRRPRRLIHALQSVTRGGTSA